MTLPESLAIQMSLDIPDFDCRLSDLIVNVFGLECGLGGRATIGMAALANGVCFKT